jgi:hypothetical protein
MEAGRALSGYEQIPDLNSRYLASQFPLGLWMAQFNELYHVVEFILRTQE